MAILQYFVISLKWQQNIVLPVEKYIYLKRFPNRFKTISSPFHFSLWRLLATHRTGDLISSDRFDAIIIRQNDLIAHPWFTMSALDNITIKGFKSIGSIENLKLGPINVLIGPNGSGKSNFIEVFSFLREIISDRLKDYVDRAGGADKILHFGSRTTEELIIDISFDDIANRYTIRLRATDTDMLYLSSESDRFWNAHSDSDIRNHADRWRVYHFHDTSSTSPMRKTDDVNDNRYWCARGWTGRWTNAIHKTQCNPPGNVVRGL